MKKAGFGTTRALLNDKVSRSILIGSLKKGETFDLIEVFMGRGRDWVHLLDILQLKNLDH